MSEDYEVVNRELFGENETRPCAMCGISKQNSALHLVTGEVIGHMGGGNVDICVDCFRSLQSGDVEPIGDPEF